MFNKKSDKAIKKSYVHHFIFYGTILNHIEISQDYNLASYTIHVLYFKFIHEWLELQFNVDSKRQIFEKFFMVNFIYFQSYCQVSDWDKVAEKIFFDIFILNWALTSNRPKKCFSYFVLMQMPDLGFEPWPHM